MGARTVYLSSKNRFTEKLKNRNLNVGAEAILSETKRQLWRVGTRQLSAFPADRSCLVSQWQPAGPEED